MAQSAAFAVDYIPGTFNIVAGDQADTAGLARHGNIILEPQPTISPNDPLNWPLWRKGIFMGIIVFFTGFTNALSVVPDTPSNILVESVGLSWNDIDNSDALYYTGMLVWLVVSAPSVYLYGSRISYILSALFGIAASVWYTQVEKGRDLLWAQFILGCSSSVMDAVVLHSMTHVFFQHELIVIVGIYAFLMYATVFLAALIGSFIVAKQDWQWIGWICLIFECVCLILIAFFLEESYFDRAHFSTKGATETLEGIETHVSSKISKEGSQNEVYHHHVMPQFSVASIKLPDVIQEEKKTNPDPPRTYFQRIALITPAVNIKGFGLVQYLKRLWLMGRVFAIPQVYFAGLQWGAQLAWLGFYKEWELDGWTSPPWNYTNIGTGLMNVPGLIGVLIGCVYSVFSTYYAMEHMSRRNKGIQEAEVTLWCMLPALVLSPLGLFLFGFGTAYNWRWPAPYVGLGFLGFGQACSGDVAVTYLIYCYPEMVLENMIGVSVIYNIIALIFSFVAEPWMESIGTSNTTISIGVLDFFFISLMFPMIKWGKPTRKWARKLYISFVQKRDSLHK